MDSGILVEKIFTRLGYLKWFVYIPCFFFNISEIF